MQHRKTLMLVLTALFAALTAIGAFFKIPFALAAISLQFLFTAMAGILLGAGYGALSQAVYVLIGLVGVPIFALGGGFSYVLQPTFGFLLGLIPSAFVIGKLAKRPLTFWGTALAMLAGLAVLYAIGVPYMALIANAYLGKGLTFWQVIKNGMLIYLPGDLLKIALGSFLCVAITRRLPAKQCADVAEELRTLISDMLDERCGNLPPTAKDVRVVLTELGTPGEMVRKYTADEDACLIGLTTRSTSTC